MSNTGIGDVIKQLRESKGWSLRTLSKRAEVPYSSISRYESGERHPGFATMEKIANALEVDISSLSSLVIDTREAHRSGHVVSERDLLEWNNLVSADQSLSDYACLIILAIPIFIDRRGWIVSVTVDSFLDRVKRLDRAMVESHWHEVIDSPYIERVGTGEWTLRLKFPELTE